MVNLHESWQCAIINNDAKIKDAVSNLNKYGLKIVLVVNQSQQLEGTISDGDIRRGLLRGLDLNAKVSEVLHYNALVVPPNMSREMVMQLMVANKIHQIPIVDKDRNVLGLHLWDEITTPTHRENTIVIMAGGMGTRLRPYTENCPKPLLKVADKPMLEHIIERAKLEGFSHFVLAVHYLGYMIRDYFEDGSKLGVKIEYIEEELPLGTAGALSLMTQVPNAPFIVTNGDVITDIKYAELLDFHIRYESSATMAVRVHEWQHPFGVVQTKGVEIIGFEEKPIARTHINAGVYVLEPSALQLLERNKVCDMPTLFERLQLADKRTVAYPMHEPWLDVGRPDDLTKANSDRNIK